MSGESARGTTGRPGGALRWVSALATSVLLLVGCSGTTGPSGVTQPVTYDDRAQLASGGSVSWAIDALPATLNAFQYDAGPVTDQIVSAVLPALFTLDESGQPQPNDDYLVSAEITEREPRQTVLYTLRPEAEWSDGESVSARDFTAQWQALNGSDAAFWSARNIGYDRIQEVKEGPEAHQVLVTFSKPYADWRSLFSPLYPASVTGAADTFNEGARTALPVAAGPFQLAELDQEAGTVRLVRNEGWWEEPALLDEMVFTVVPPSERRAALNSGAIDVIEVSSAEASRLDAVRQEPDSGKPGQGAESGDPGTSAPAGPGRAETVTALDAWARAQASGDDEPGVERAAGRDFAQALFDAEHARDVAFAAQEAAATERLRDYQVHRAYAPAYTQLAMNGTVGPLRDQRVRQAVARALDRTELAESVHQPAGLAARPLGNHLWMIDQHGYRDNSAALGTADGTGAASLLEEAGWEAEPGQNTSAALGHVAGHMGAGTWIAGLVGKPAAAHPVQLSAVRPAAGQRASVLRQAASMQRREATQEETRRLGKEARATERAAADAADHAARLAADAAAAIRIKDGEPLRLRFVLPSGPGGEQLRDVGERITEMLAEAGIRAEIVEVPDESYFTDHVAPGDYDLALYSWPASAYPATDARPLFTKPQPVAGGELFIEQNYPRVGTDHIDQLLDQASSELEPDEQRGLLNDADTRIWAAAGSVPLFQRPQLVAAKAELSGVGAYGLATPRYQDIGYRQ